MHIHDDNPADEIRICAAVGLHSQLAAVEGDHRIRALYIRKIPNEGPEFRIPHRFVVKAGRKAPANCLNGNRIGNPVDHHGFFAKKPFVVIYHYQAIVVTTTGKFGRVERSTNDYLEIIPHVLGYVEDFPVQCDRLRGSGMSAQLCLYGDHLAESPVNCNA